MNKKTILSILLPAIAFAGFAQEDEKVDENLSTTVMKISTYRPTISDARKLAEKPTIMDTVLPKPEPSYLYGNQPVQTSFMPDSIQPARMKGEPLNPLYRAYARAGAGNGVNYLADFYVNALRSREGALGFELHGRGAQGLFTDLPPAPYNRWNGEVNGKKFFKKHALDCSVGYDRERLQYYGYDLSEDMSLAIYDELTNQNLGDDKAIRNQFKQYYQRIYAGANLKSFYTDSSDLNHVIQLDYYNWSDRNAANSENNVKVSAKVSRYFGAHQLRAELMSDMNFVKYVAPFQYNPIGAMAESQSNILVGLKPTMVSTWKKLRIEYGANVQLEIDNGGTTPKIYPHAYAKYNLVKEVIIPYAGLGGGLKRNSLSSFSELNPFIWSSRTALLNTNEVLRIYGGFRGSVSDRLTYNIQAAQFYEQNAALFINYDASQYNQGVTRFGENYFLVNYDTLETFEINGELMYRIGERLQVVGYGAYRMFQTTTEFEAWHRPAMEAALTGFYQIKNKIIAKAQLHFYGPQWSKSYEPTSDKFYGNDGADVYGNKVSPIVDLNLGVEYRYTERLSGFVNVNNVIAQRYQRWNQYPSQRLNLLAGVTYSFWKE
ncbi:MAG: hypothetical protein KC456_04245 [Flavobacteriales bacterium]|jgi:hypothetical protein|nr:hypothetical protein [Flavobacteriales bacterium]